MPILKKQLGTGQTEYSNHDALPGKEYGCQYGLAAIIFLSKLAKLFINSQISAESDAAVHSQPASPFVLAVLKLPLRHQAEHQNS